MTSRNDPERRRSDDRDLSEFPEAFRRQMTPLAPEPGSFEDIRSRARARRRTRGLWTGIALAGCVVAGAVALTSTGGTSPSTVAVSSDGTSAQGRTQPPSGEAKSAPANGSAAPGGKDTAQGPVTCKTANLKVTLGRGEGAAGSQYRPLQITNKGDTPCFLFGFPGVSIVDSAGKQVGKAAARDGSQASGKVVMKPGQREQVTLRIVNAANFSDAQCKLTHASAIRVYPPGERQSVVVPVKGLEGCASTAVEILTVTSYGVH
jgi:hypothetical protein